MRFKIKKSDVAQNYHIRMGCDVVSAFNITYSYLYTVRKLHLIILNLNENDFYR